MSIKEKDDPTTGFSCSALSLWVDWHPAQKSPAVVPVSLSFVGAPAHPGVSGKGRVSSLYPVLYL